MVDGLEFWVLEMSVWSKKSGLLVLFLRMGQVTGPAHEEGSSFCILEMDIWGKEVW